MSSTVGFVEEVGACYGMSFELLRQDAPGDTAYIVWTAETADSRFEVATDTFIVQNGTILTQTFGAKISPKH